MATRYKQTKSKTYISHGLKDIRVLILDQTITFFSTKQYQLPSKSKPQLSFQPCKVVMTFFMFYLVLTTQY
jgi:hypothetical protein